MQVTPQMIDLSVTVSSKNALEAIAQRLVRFDGKSWVLDEKKLSAAMSVLTGGDAAETDALVAAVKLALADWHAAHAGAATGIPLPV